MRRLMTAVAIMLVCVVVSGCTQDVKNAWKTTKKYYGKYVNKPATLELGDTDAEPVEERLAMLYTTIGIELERFRRDLENRDTYPSEGWMNEMLEKYPWLSGLAAQNTEGRILLQRPEFGMKSLDFSPLLETDEKAVERDMRGVVLENPLGAEIALGMPYYIDNTYKGVVVAHFDPRNLVALSERPDLLIMIGPSGAVWNGRFDLAATPVPEENWSEVLADSSSGYVENETGEFFWISKFFGSLPLAFATTTDDFPLLPVAEEAPAETRVEQIAPKAEEPVEAELAPAEAVSARQETEAAAERAPSEPATEKAAASIVPSLHEEPTPPPATTDYVWSVQIGAFQNPEYAQDRLKLLTDEGLSPCLMKLYDKKGQLWNVVQIGDYRSKQQAYKRVGEFLKHGTGLEFNVDILDAGVVERRKQCF